MSKERNLDKEIAQEIESQKVPEELKQSEYEGYQQQHDNEQSDVQQIMGDMSMNKFNNPQSMQDNDSSYQPNEE